MSHKELALKLTGSWGKNRETVEREATELIAAHVAEHCAEADRIAEAEFNRATYFEKQLTNLQDADYLRDRL